LKPSINRTRTIATTGFAQHWIVPRPWIVSALLASVDACYGEESALAACVLFGEWMAGTPDDVVTAQVEGISAYQPGAFYKRELPVLLAVLHKIKAPLRAVIVDGYVWLDARQTPGLGAHLHDAFLGRVPVIGVAKTALRGDDWSLRVMRGKSRHPLLVTAAGYPGNEAAEAIRTMHGDGRIPTMLRLADHAARMCPGSLRRRG
jgi:deoxyribonuclease V